MSTYTYQEATPKQIVGSGGAGRIKTSFKKLLATFGSPKVVESFDKKVRVQWAFKVDRQEAGAKVGTLIVTIYDYKDDNKLEKVTDWHIGGKGNAKEIVNWVCEKLDLDPKESARI